MVAFVVVKIEVARESVPGFVQVRIIVQIDLFVFYLSFQFSVYGDS